MSVISPALQRHLALSVFLVLGTCAAKGQGDVILDRAAMPDGQTVSGCSLSPSSNFALNGNREVVGEAPVANPWRGADARYVVNIRERLEGVAPLPDGPPLTQTELARFRSKLVEDVEEGYAAVYGAAGAQPVTVYGLRFKTAVPRELTRETAMKGAALHIVRGRTVLAVYGERGRCLEAVTGYISGQ
jgi:hypothetical protein